MSSANRIKGRAQGIEYEYEYRDAEYEYELTAQSWRDRHRSAGQFVLELVLSETVLVLVLESSGAVG